MAALQERHPGTGLQGTTRTPARPEPETCTDEEGLATVRHIFGDHIQWTRAWDTHTNDEGATIYVDPRTSRVYSTLPRMDPIDGRDL